MLVLGVDPGLERVGYGFVRREGSKLSSSHYGLIETPRIALPDRLVLIHEQLDELIQTYRPDAFATEMAAGAKLPHEEVNALAGGNGGLRALAVPV